MTSETETGQRVGARRWRLRPVLVLVGIVAAVALSLAPSAAHSDPTADRHAAAFDRVSVARMPPGIAAHVAPLARGMPAFVCQMLELRVPVAVRNFLESLGIGPCASE